MHLRKFALQLIALAVVAVGLIWTAGSGVAVQTTTVEANNIYNKLYSDLGEPNGNLLADTSKIDATEGVEGLQPPRETTDSRETLFKNIKVFDQMAMQIQNRYMEEIDPKELIRAGIRGMLQNLDPFSVLMEKTAYDRLMESTHGKYEGLGMQIDKRDDRIQIMSPIEGTPAYSKGLRAGDIIWEINGTSTYKMDTPEASGLMRGPAGTPVTLKIKRPGVPDLLDYELQRALITLKSVNYYGFVDGTNIAYIRLSRFAEETGNELKAAIADLKGQKQVTGVIFDLRSNGGGLLEQAVETSNLFLDKDKLVVYTLGRTPSTERRYYSVEDPLLPQEKLVFLVDEGTASASEIVSGAIQDWDRGIIMGQPTYGKGLVQQIYTTEASDEFALKLTTAKYYVPSGRCIQKPERSKKTPMAMGADEEDVIAEDSIADTLKVQPKEVFTTNGGRTVYGGGGIIPDVQIEPEKWLPIEINMERQSMFFDFAVTYTTAHPELDRSFDVTNDVLAAFEDFLKEKKFDYKTSLEVALDEMKNVVKEENKETLFSASLDSLAGLIVKEKESDFDRSQEYIKRAIKREIIAKLFGERGVYEEIVLKTDRGVRKAMEVLRDDKEYSRIIKGETDKAEL
jgi:carboxyl-terminal processing protease